MVVECHKWITVDHLRRNQSLQLFLEHLCIMNFATDTHFLISGILLIELETSNEQ